MQSLSLAFLVGLTFTQGLALAQAQGPANSVKSTDGALARGSRVVLAQAPANSVKITDQSGSAQTNRPFTISRVFAQSEIPHCPQAQVNSAAVPTQCDVKTRWPDASVQHVLISFLASIGANGSITVSFVDQPQPATGGGLTQAQMLALTWNAEIDVTNGTTLTASARTMLGAGKWSYWLQGPICTQVIVEDRSTALAYDMGWDTYKPLHPIFVLTFYPGTTAGVKTEMILENMWTTKLEDQKYDLALKTGQNLASAYTKQGFTHVALSRWRKVFWDGAQPGAVNVDYNLPYMIYSQAVPNWDLSRVVPPDSINSDVGNFSGSDKGDLGGHALWERYMPNTGGRFDIGVFPVWYVHYLFTFDPRMLEVILGLAEAGAHVPSHLRESATNRFFDGAHMVNAFGYPVSLDARPDLSLVYGLASGPDAIPPVGPTSDGGWTWDLAHLPAFAYIPYLITGDWYFLEELQIAASHDLVTGNSSFNFYSRGGSIGWIPYSLQTRGAAWGLRDVAQSAFVSPDSSPQKAYYTEKLDNNIAVEEGFQNITNGSFRPADAACPNYVPSATADKWCYGRLIVGEDKVNQLNLIDHGDPYGGGCNGGDTLVPPSDAYGCSYGGIPFENGYKYGVLGHIEELGFPIDPLNRVVFKSLLHMISDPAVNPWLVAVYHVPNYRASTNTYFETWSDYMLGFNPAAQCGNGTIINWRVITGWNGTCNGGASDADVLAPGYPHIMRSAASYLAGLKIDDGTLHGTDAWTWMDTHVGYGDQTGVNPQWELLPHGQTSTPPPGGGAPPVPSLNGINPNSGTQGATITNVTLSGSNLAGATINAPTGINVSNVTTSVGSVTATFAISASAPTGAQSVTVTTGGGTSNGVTFTVNAAGSGGGPPPGGGGGGLPQPNGKIQVHPSYVAMQMEQMNGNEIACQMITENFPNVHVFCRQYGAEQLAEDVNLPVGDLAGVTVRFNKHAMDSANYANNNLVVQAAQVSTNVVTFDITANEAHASGQITCGQNGVGCSQTSSATSFTSFTSTTPATSTSATLPQPSGKIQVYPSYVAMQMEQMNGNEIACQMQTEDFPNVHIFCRQYGAEQLAEDVNLPAGDMMGVTVDFNKHAMDTANYANNSLVIIVAQPEPNVVTFDITANAAHASGQITCGQNGVGCP